MKYSTRKYQYIKVLKFTILLVFFMMSSCVHSQKGLPMLTGAEQTDLYLPIFKDLRVAIVANHSSLVRDSNHSFVHLVDTLLHLKIKIQKIFAPEHGFRGTTDAGSELANSIDAQSGLQIISLYGKNKKPNKSDLSNVDTLIFDIQDVGVRFYTYISTLHYVMEAAAENNIPLIIFDRPNPNGHYIDGPVLDLKQKSFVGMHPVPIVYGMTIGEYAQMINGERWLGDQLKCQLSIIPLKGYKHQQRFELFVPPSPNLPNQRAVNLYPSLCFFEGTNVNSGRGTKKQFQVYGSPYLEDMPYHYTPESLPGATSPKHLGKECRGEDLSDEKYLEAIELRWLLKAYQQTLDKKVFFNGFFKNLAGQEILQKQIEQGYSEEVIRASWKKDLKNFKKLRAKYLLYN